MSASTHPRTYVRAMVLTCAAVLLAGVLALGLAPVASATSVGAEPTMSTGLASADEMGFLSLATGASHVIGIKTDGTVWAWGRNSDGQLGDGTTTDRATPVQLTALTGARTIVAGYNYSMAIKNDGTVWAWGDNQYSQLGDGTTTDRSSPVQISSLTGARQLSASQMRSAAIRGDGTVWMWGGGVLSPNQVSSLTGARQVVAGDYHYLAIAAGGTVWAWGTNNRGQLGDGTVTDRLTPVQISSMTGARQLFAGFRHSMGIKSDGTVWAWGENNYGQLGTGGGNVSTPTQVTGLTGARSMDVQGNHGLAVMADGTVKGWGDNQTGQFGDGTTGTATVPVGLSALTGARAVYVGGNAANVSGINVSQPSFSMAVMSDFSIKASGANTYGQLGDGTTTTRASTGDVTRFRFGCGVVRAWANNYFSAALKSDGTVWLWGDGSDGQLGNGTNTMSQTTPVQITALTGARQLALGADHAMAILADGTVWTWGDGAEGQLGRGSTTDSNVPVQISSLTGARQIAAGTAHSMVIMSNGTYRAFGGAGNGGAIGDGSTTDRTSPVAVASLAGARELFGPNGLTDLSNTFAMAILADGSVSAWGAASNYRLGLGPTSTNRPSPVAITGLAGARSITLGSVGSSGGHGIAMMSDGTVRGWGGNGWGQLGNGSLGSDVTAPTTISGLTGATLVQTGSNFTFVQSGLGSVLGFGENSPSMGKLGLGTAAATYPSPTSIPALAGAHSIDTGGRHSVAIASDGSLLAWGYNYAGSIGDGTTTMRSSPVTIMPGTCAPSDTTAPTPNPMTATAIADSSTQITVSASAAADETALDAAPYSVDTGTPAWQASTTFVKSGLSPNTLYAWTVRARDAAGNESTGSVQRYTLPGLPTAVSAVAQSWNATDGSAIDVSWTAPSGGATSYNIRSSADAYATVVATSANTTRRVASLAPGTSYTFRVCAVNADGAEGACASASPAITAPAAPTSPTTGAIDDVSAVLDWSDVSGASGYQAFVYSDASCTAQVAASGTVAPSTWTATSLAYDAPYWFQARAVSGATTGQPTACTAFGSTSTRTALSMSVDASSVSLGAFAPGVAQTASTIVTVGSRRSTTFTLYAQVDHQLQNGALTIPAISSGTAAAPAAWSGTGFGFTVSGAGADARWSSGPKYAPFGTSSAAINVVTGLNADTATESTALTVGYRVLAAGSQGTGTYTAAVTYTAVAAP